MIDRVCYVCDRPATHRHMLTCLPLCLRCWADDMNGEPVVERREKALKRAWERAHTALEWRYGPITANRIATGKHEPSQRDLAAWRNLGVGR